MGVFCEDDESELHRRFVGIASHYDVPLSALTDLHVKSLAGEDAIMAAPSRGGIIEPTPLFSKLEAEAKKVRPRIIVLDNSADLYAGDENNRTQVRQFIGLLRRLAMQSGAAIVLSSHPSLTGESSGSGLSGSTAWNASVRARLYLRRQPRAKKDEPQPAPNARTLEVMKNNYGATGEKIELRWQDGLFLPSDDTVSLAGTNPPSRSPRRR